MDENWIKNGSKKEQKWKKMDRKWTENTLKPDQN